MRTLEVAYIASTSDLERGNLRAKASTEATAASMAAANAKTGASYLSMSGAGKKAAADLESSHNKMASSLAGIGRSSNIAIAGLIGLGAAAYGVKKSVDTTAELAKETLLLHNVTGLSVQSASAYAAVAQVQGLNVKGLNQAFGTLSKNVQAVINAHEGLTKGAKTQENAFRNLGLPLSSIIKAHGDMNKLLPEITKRFEEMPPGIEKAATGMALFGRGWQTLVPLMHTGTLGLAEQLKVAKEMGVQLGGSTAQQQKQFIQDQEKMKYATLGLQVAVAQYLAPALGKLISTFASVENEVRKMPAPLKDALEAVLGLTGVLVGLVVATKAITAVSTAMGVLRGMFVSTAATAVASEATMAEAVVTADGTIEAANVAAGASFTAMLGPIAAVAAAVYALNKILPKGENVESLLGGNQPGESGREGEVFAKTHGGYGGPSISNTQGGIMAFFMAKGLSATAAAGIAGNVQQESSFNPNAPGGGLFQDIGSRAASGRGSITHQLEAAWRELQGMPELLAELKRAKTPQEAAHIFSGSAASGKGFERPGTPEFALRERYAREAFRAHPQSHPSRGSSEEGEEEPPGALGYITPKAKAPKTSHTKAKTVKAEAYSNPFAGASNVSRSRTDQGVDFSFKGSLGAVGKGRIVNIIQDPGGFGTEVVEELTEGPHKGQFVYYGLETGAVLGISKGANVASGQRIATGKGSGGIELGFASGPGGVPVTPGSGETAGGKAFSSFLGSIGKGGSNLQLASAQAVEAAKKVQAEAAHLMISVAQQLHLHTFVASAGVAHAAVEHYAERVTGAEGALGVNQARRLAGKQPLSSPIGAKAAEENANEAVLTAKAEKGYYQHELAALNKEAKAWGKLRDSYLSFARHAHGNAKKEALTKAAQYEAKVATAQKDAKTLGGSIESAETKITEAEAAQAALPAEIAAAQAQAATEQASGDLSAYQAVLTKIAAEERAGLLTPDQAKQRKVEAASKAVGGGFGPLDEAGMLQAKGDLREFSKATAEATSALEAHTNALKESAKILAEFNHASERLAGIEQSTLLKAMADLISGEIGGRAYAARAMTPGAGTAARY